jgi:hypothetical protein
VKAAILDRDESVVVRTITGCESGDLLVTPLLGLVVTPKVVEPSRRPMEGEPLLVAVVRAALLFGGLRLEGLLADDASCHEDHLVRWSIGLQMNSPPI